MRFDFGTPRFFDTILSKCNIRDCNEYCKFILPATTANYLIQPARWELDYQGRLLLSIAFLTLGDPHLATTFDMIGLHCYLLQYIR